MRIRYIPFSPRGGNRTRHSWEYIDLRFLIVHVHLKQYVNFSTTVESVTSSMVLGFGQME